VRNASSAAAAEKRRTWERCRAMAEAAMHGLAGGRGCRHGRGGSLTAWERKSLAAMPQDVAARLAALLPRLGPPGAMPQRSPSHKRKAV